MSVHIAHPRSIPSHPLLTRSPAGYMWFHIVSVTSSLSFEKYVRLVHDRPEMCTATRLLVHTKWRRQYIMFGQLRSRLVAVVLPSQSSRLAASRLMYRAPLRPCPDLSRCHGGPQAPLVRWGPQFRLYALSQVPARLLLPLVLRPMSLGSRKTRFPHAFQSRWSHLPMTFSTFSGVGSRETYTT
ncbi:hypothetical protein BS17DRAFT_280684 [Gyrodon lividus]|nr:hypothetical protein BS17DRAFT_280684 [Gyrodon lividus]